MEAILFGGGWERSNCAALKRDVIRSVRRNRAWSSIKCGDHSVHGARTQSGRRATQCGINYLIRRAVWPTSVHLSIAHQPSLVVSCSDNGDWVPAGGEFVPILTLWHFYGIRTRYCDRHHYYAALLPRRGPHIASHSVCLSVCPSVPLSLPW